MTEEPETKGGQDSEPTASKQAREPVEQDTPSSSRGPDRPANLGETAGAEKPTTATEPTEPEKTAAAEADKAVTAKSTEADKAETTQAAPADRAETTQAAAADKAETTQAAAPGQDEATASGTSAKPEASAAGTSAKPEASAAGTSAEPEASAASATSGESGKPAAVAVDAPEPTGKWWQQQRWIVPLAIIVLALAAFGVGALVSAERNDTLAPALGLESEPPPSQPAPSPAPAALEQEQDDDIDEQQDPQTAQVCDRIIAFQQDIQSGGIEPLDVFNELRAIERDARGTELASQANNAGETVQQLFVGEATLDDVYASVTDLASTCSG